MCGGCFLKIIAQPNGEHLIKIVMTLLLMSAAWPIRGQFGHFKGAMITGVFAVCSLLWLKPFDRYRWVLGRSFFLGALGFGLGGVLGYGQLVELCMNTPVILDVWHAWMDVFLIGMVWSGLGMTYLGFAWSEKDLSWLDMIFLLGPVLAMVAVHEGFDTPESAVLLAHLGLLHIYNLVLKRSSVVCRVGFSGLFGGVVLCVAVLILWAGHQGHLFGTWWQLRDQFWGAGIGLILVLAAKMSKNEIPLSQSSSIQRILEALGWLTVLVAVMGLNAGNVLHYWFEKGFLNSESWIIGRWITLGLIALGVSIWFYIWPRYASLKVFRALFLIVFWLLAILATAKEVMLVGWQRWEPGFSWIALVLVILSVSLIGRSRFSATS